MALPVINQPLYNLQIPSSGVGIKYRGFSVGEEKILLTAKESNDPEQILTAIGQILTNCVQDTLDFNSLWAFDIEYIFMSIYTKSVSNVVEITFTDATEPVEINLDAVLLDQSPVFPSQNMAINETITVSFKPFSFLNVSSNAFKDQSVTEMLCSMIDTITDVASDSVYKAESYTYIELRAFVEQLPLDTMKEFQKYIQNSPVLKYTVDVIAKNGDSYTREIVGFQNFFTS